MRDTVKRRLRTSKVTGALAAASVLIVIMFVWLAPMRNAGAHTNTAPVPTPRPVPANSSDLNLMMTIPPWPASMIMSEGPMRMVMLHLTGIQPTWAEVSRVYTMLSATKAAAAKYQDIRVAIRDGYTTAGWLDVPTQGVHYVNERYTPNRFSAFDPSKAWILVYNRINGAMKLSGVLYGMPADSTPAELAAVFPPSMASWHQHIDLCIQPDRALPFHDSVTCLAHQGQFIGRTQWVVHAWLWTDGATPVFAMDRS